LKGATQIWAEILNKWGTRDYNQDQVYAYWSHINEAIWRLADDQVESARLVLQAVDGRAIEMLPITPEAGISTIAFALKEPLDGYGNMTAELAMDSTCGSLSINFRSRYLLLSRENKC